MKGGAFFGALAVQNLRDFGFGGAKFAWDVEVIRCTHVGKAET